MGIVVCCSPCTSHCCHALTASDTLMALTLLSLTLLSLTRERQALRGNQWCYIDIHVARYSESRSNLMMQFLHRWYASEVFTSATIRRHIYAVPIRHYYTRIQSLPHTLSNSAALLPHALLSPGEGQTHRCVCVNNPVHPLTSGFIMDSEVTVASTARIGTPS